jgi:hypothetical protein
MAIGETKRRAINGSRCKLGRKHQEEGDSNKCTKRKI